MVLSDDPKFRAFFKHYTSALDEGVAALFAGAGLSQPSGYVNWRQLLKDVADELDLDVTRETDLIALAQYYLNTRRNRGRLNRLLIEEFTRDVSVTEAHRLIAKLPIRTIWTTNYDTLLEQAFEQANKKVDKKIVLENLATTTLNRDVTVYKMHGDISQPDKAVLTKDDYETYSLERELFSTVLQADLTTKTFLFLGYSFNDPNLDYILSRIRVLLGTNQREHYCVMRRLERPARDGKSRKDYERERAEYEYQRRKQELRIDDLRRYSIEALMLDDYAQVNEILRELNRRSHRKGVFVSGSAHTFDPLGKNRVEDLSRTLGREIIRRGYNLISGFGLGIGNMVTLGALEQVYSDGRESVGERTVLRPFPQPGSGSATPGLWPKYREEMLSVAGFAIFLCGNKQDRASGDTVIADGMLEEFRIAKAMGVYPLPVGATGHAARQIWDEVVKDLSSYYSVSGLKRLFNTLGDPRKTNREILDTIFEVMEKVLPK
jgi:hypothetical protein